MSCSATLWVTTWAQNWKETCYSWTARLSEFGWATVTSFLAIQCTCFCGNRNQQNACSSHWFAPISMETNIMGKKKKGNDCKVMTYWKLVSALIFFFLSSLLYEKKRAYMIMSQILATTKVRVRNHGMKLPGALAVQHQTPERHLVCKGWVCILQRKAKTHPVY